MFALRDLYNWVSWNCYWRIWPKHNTHVRMNDHIFAQALTKIDNKRLLNSVLVGYEDLLRQKFVLSHR